MSKHSKPDEWLPLYVGDYLRDTMHLTAEQHGAYLLLLMHYWVRRGPLVDDDSQLAAIAKTELKIWKKSVRAVVSNFFEISDGKWTQKRMQSEIARADGISETRSFAGKRGNEARWQSDRKQDRKQDGKPIANGVAKPVAKSSQNDPPFTNRQDSSASSSTLRPARENARSQLLALCDCLGVSPATDASILTRWTDELETLRLDGFDFEKHILPAARATAAKNVKPKSLNYLRGKANELRASEEIAATQHQQQPAMEDDDGWRARMRIFSGRVREAEKGSWHSKWGPKPNEPGCLVPSHILAEFAVKESA